MLTHYVTGGKVYRKDKIESLLCWQNRLLLACGIHIPRLTCKRKQNYRTTKSKHITDIYQPHTHTVTDSFNISYGSCWTSHSTNKLLLTTFRSGCAFSSGQCKKMHKTGNICMSAQITSYLFYIVATTHLGVCSWHNDTDR